MMLFFYMSFSFKPLGGAFRFHSYNCNSRANGKCGVNMS